MRVLRWAPALSFFLVMLTGASLGDSHRLGLGESFSGIGGTIGGPHLAPLPVVSHLRGYWTFDDADSGVVFVDRAQNFSLAKVGAPSSVAGSVAQGRSFNGSTDAFTYPDPSGPSNGEPWTHASLLSSGNHWTYTAHLKFTAGSKDIALVSTDNGSGGGAQRDFEIRYANAGSPGAASLYIQSYIGGVLQYRVFTTTGNFDDSGWFDLVFTYDGTTYSAYLNGQSVPQVSNSMTGLFPSGSELPSKGLFSYLGSVFHAGKIDEQTWWNTEFSSDQASTVHSLRVAGTPMSQFMATPARADPYWQDVVFMSHFDTTSWVDETGRHTASVTGTPTNPAGLFGNALGCNSNAGVVFPASTEWTFPGDYTVELTAHLASPLAANRTLIGNYGLAGSSSGAWTLAADASQIYLYVEGVAFPAIAYGTPLGTGANRIALVRSGSTTSLFINGTRVAQTTTAMTMTGVLYTLGVGTDNSGTSSYWADWIDEARITQAARYTGASYTLDATPFPNH